MNKQRTIRKFLDLSTAHLPVDLRDVREIPGCHITEHAYGLWLWVPDDPRESAKAGEEEVPEAILAVQLYARDHGCDYVNFDADGDLCSDLPVFEDEGEGGPPYDAATRTGMYDHD